jgi:hypothetical protein
MRAAIALVAGAVAAWVAPMALAIPKVPSDRVSARLVALGLALVASVAAALAVTAAGPILLLMPLTSAAFSLLAGEGGALYPLVGVKCTTFEIVMAFLPVVTAMFIVRRDGMPAPARLVVAAAAASGALAGHAILHLTCPVPTATSHLLVFHTGGVLLAALLGAAAARLLVPAGRR